MYGFSILGIGALQSIICRELNYNATSERFEVRDLLGSPAAICYRTEPRSPPLTRAPEAEAVSIEAGPSIFALHRASRCMALPNPGFPPPWGHAIRTVQRK